MRTLAQDLRFGLRMSLKSPGFTLVAVLTLAVGIAASTTIFSWIDNVLLRPIPGVVNGHELMSFESLTPNGDSMPSSYPDYQDHRDHLKLLAGLAMVRPDPLSIGEEDHAERIWGELVTGNYFALLGVKPALGRFFSPEEYGDKQGGYPVVVISHSLWKRPRDGKARPAEHRQRSPRRAHLGRPGDGNLLGLIGREAGKVVS